ncbi:uncharacterized protein LY89DRAFT_680520 [Mollisia scopiformis]|uniref:Uncharacterized protein n=1 Tax=Mollisia scopiformis TaxID=149040 RepID=A0A194XQ48_MOLSC|nr:uncharacterized protein LY89DRAFT_680520 [Mollisia scopiformis]KUJ22385.1 hypothetical protein LY89DRAFT_680520 [Mollisia scopiformis]
MYRGSSERIAVILDFDGTITTKDTISTLANIGLSSQKDQGIELSRAWASILSKYSEDYSNHIKAYRPVKEERSTLEEELKYYRSLREIELKSFARVSNSGLFKGIEDWEKHGHDAVKEGQVIVRKGFQEFVTSLADCGIVWGVVSVNFSSDFIRGVLKATVGDKKAKVSILANSILSGGFIVGLEIEERASRPVMATSGAKFSATKRLLYTWGISSEQEQQTLLYIGDSGTDIECLTANGVTGVVMSDDGQSDLMKRLKQIGIYVGNIQIDQGNQEQMYWARDFDEIVGSPVFKQLTQIHQKE